MNKIKHIILFLTLITVLGSCKESWLDINEDPNTPSNTTASVKSRLPWVQHHFLYAQGTAGARAALVSQHITFVSSTAQQSMAAGWNPIAGMATTPYQFFFVASAANIQDLMDKAEKESAAGEKPAAVAKITIIKHNANDTIKEVSSVSKFFVRLSNVGMKKIPAKNQSIKKKPNFKIDSINSTPENC